MKLTTFTVSAILAMANACNTELWGQGTCDYPLETASGNGAPITEEVVLALGACFESVFGGTGPYTLDGISLPDAGGTGTAWGVSMVIDGSPFAFTIGNLCSCSQSVDINVLADLSDTANSGSFLTIVERCGVNSDACPAAGAPGGDGGTLPSGVYAAVESCPDNPCDLNGLPQTGTC